MPETSASIATLTPSQICLQHNIRSGAATEPDDDAPFALLAGEENDDFITSIQAQGILIRCTVRNTGPCEHGKDYVAVAGHRRITAEALVRGWDDGAVPVEIVEQERMLDVVTMLVENLQRTDLNALDEARGYAELINDHGWKQAEVAASVGRATSHVSERLQLLALPDEAKDRLVAGALPIRAALKIAKAPAAVQDLVLAEKVIRENTIDVLIDSATGKVKRAKLKAEQLAQLEAEGWNILKSHPEGSVQVVLKGDHDFYSLSPLRLDLTKAQFRKEPGAFAVVKVEQWQDKVVVLYGTTAPEQYTGKNAPKADKIAEKAKPIKDDSQAKVDEVTAHRQAWWQSYLAQPIDPKVAQSTLLAIGWETVVRQRSVELAEDLKLVSDEEMGLGANECINRLDSYIEGKSSKEQTRVIHLAAMENIIRRGVNRWDPFEVPARLTALGYEPHPLEVEAQAKMAAYEAEVWTVVRNSIEEETASLTDEEKAILAAAMDEAQQNGEDADEFHHPLIETATERKTEPEVEPQPDDSDEDYPHDVDDDVGDDVRYEGMEHPE